MSEADRAGRGLEPAMRRVDAALQDTVALLEMVRREEQVLVRLGRCVVELEEIARARSALADRTDSEVMEARQWLHDQDQGGFEATTGRQR